MNKGTVTTADREPVVILIPVYKDWVAVSIVLRDLDSRLTNASMRVRVRVLLVNDHSATCDTDRLREALASFQTIERLDVLHLRRNLGHQRAIAVGLCHVEAEIPCSRVVVMDGDGEDAPSDVPRLLQAQAASPDRIIFAKRVRRSEGLLFQLLYRIYKVPHRILTGISVQIGNFSVVPYPVLSQITVLSELWSHYAAAVTRGNLSYEMIATDRAPRVAGRSRMKLPALVSHGLSALAVHGDLIGVRLLIATVLLGGVLLVVLVAVLALRVSTALAIPGWASTIGGLLLVLLSQLLLFGSAFVLLILSKRSSSIIPCRDYQVFVDRVSSLSAP